MSSSPSTPVLDADNHFYEPREALLQYLPRQYRHRIRYVEVDGRTKIAVNGTISDYIPNPTFDVVARPGAHTDFYTGNNPDGRTQRQIGGEPMASIPAFREPGPRLALLDEQGVQATLMFPSLASVLEERLKDDPEFTHVAIHALNQWMHETWTFDYHGRIFATPIITLPIVERAIAELEWVLERGARAVLIRPAPVPGIRFSRSFGLPEFDPFWARAEEAGVLVCFHASDSGYSRYVNEWEGGGEYQPFQGTPFVWATLGMGKRPIEDAVTAILCHGAASRFPNLRLASIENGSRWVPHVLEAVERVYRMMPQEFPEHPVDAFRRCFWVNPFWEEDPAEVLSYLDVDKILFGSDYPHPEGLADPLSYADKLTGLSPGTQAQILGGNLAGLLGVGTLAITGR